MIGCVFALAQRAQRSIDIARIGTRLREKIERSIWQGSEFPVANISRRDLYEYWSWLSINGPFTVDSRITYSHFLEFEEPFRVSRQSAKASPQPRSSS
jgi:hypothetical protein